MSRKVKTVIKRIILLIVAFGLEGFLAFLLINGIENNDLANSKIIILIMALMLMIPLALLALLFALTFKNHVKKAASASKNHQENH